MTRPKRLHMVRPTRGQAEGKGRGPLFFLCLFFLIGALLGSVFALLGGSHPQLAEQLQVFFQSVARDGTPSVSLWSTLWEAICWPLLLILLSFGPPGVVGIPCVFLVRGFLLSYACSSFVSMYGLVGLGWNALFFGVSALLLLPVCMCVGQWAFTNACKRCFPQEPQICIPPSGAMLTYCGILLALFFFLQGHILPLCLPQLCQKLLSLL